jgi:hypothetical protein
MLASISRTAALSSTTSILTMTPLSAIVAALVKSC